MWKISLFKGSYNKIDDLIKEIKKLKVSPCNNVKFLDQNLLSVNNLVDTISKIDENFDS